MDELGNAQELELVLVGDEPEALASLYAALVPLYGADRIHPLDAQALDKHEEHFALANSVWLIAGDLPLVQAVLPALLAHGCSEKRVLVLAPETHMELLKFCHSAGIVCETAIDMDSAILQHRVQSLWNDHTNSILTEEIRIACDFGALPLLCGLAGQESAKLTERARYTYALAAALTADQNVIRRCLRLALLRDITRVNEWEKLTGEARHFWWIRDLLLTQQQLNFLECTDPWPQEAPVELIVVGVGQLLIDHGKGGAEQFRQAVRDKTVRLPFKFRTNLRLAVERICRRLWREDAAAA